MTSAVGTAVFLGLHSPAYFTLLFALLRRWNLTFAVLPILVQQISLDLANFWAGVVYICNEYQHLFPTESEADAASVFMALVQLFWYRIYPFPICKGTPNIISFHYHLF